jgi:hypothetical protein
MGSSPRGISASRGAAITSEKKRASARAWKKRNTEKVKADRSAYYQSHKEKEIETAKKWNAENRERYLNNIKERHGRRRTIETAYNRERKRTNVEYWLSIIIGKRLNRASRDYRFKKCASAKDLLGCNVTDLKRHLEFLFDPGMTWENRGAWHIDHVRPCSSFDFSQHTSQRACFHYSNMQPLWAKANRQKGNKYGQSA